MSVRYLRYVLTLRDPALFTGPSGDPNSATSLGHIPGAAIRGAVARAIGDNEPAIERLILSGRVRYLDALPAYGDVRTLPAPLSWRVDKNDVDSRVTDIIWGGDKQGMRSPHFRHHSMVDGTLRPLDVARVGRAHHQRDAAFPGHGRPFVERLQDEEIAHGAVFTYEAIAGEVSLSGVLLLDARGEADTDAAATELNRLEAELRTALGKPLLLGRSRRAGYGGNAVIHWLDRQERESLESTLVSSDLAKGELFRVLLLSDAVARDRSTGQIDPHSVLDELILALPGSALALPDSFAMGSSQAGGYNRVWRLPLPLVPTARAGSVFDLEAQEAIALTTVLAAEHAGIGERRIDGFGRFAVMQSPETTLSLARIETAVIPPRPISTVPAFGLAVERRLAEDELRKSVRRAAAEVARSCTRPPSGSLLGRLRIPLRDTPHTALDTLAKWLRPPDPSAQPTNDSALRKPAMRQLERCRVHFDRSPAGLGPIADGAVDTIADLLRRLSAADESRSLLLDNLLDPEGRLKTVAFDHVQSLLDWYRQPAEQARWAAALADEVLHQLELDARRARRSSDNG